MLLTLFLRSRKFFTSSSDCKRQHVLDVSILQYSRKVSKPPTAKNSCTWQRQGLFLSKLFKLYKTIINFFENLVYSEQKSTLTLCARPFENTQLWDRKFSLSSSVVTVIVKCTNCDRTRFSNTALCNEHTPTAYSSVSYIFSGTKPKPGAETTHLFAESYFALKVEIKYAQLLTHFQNNFEFPTRLFVLFC